jgi:beta-lactamase regulating signal transducer with metallopeptidase domain
MMTVIDLAVKGSLLLGVAWSVAWLLRRGSAATRYLVWSTALSGLLVLPLLAAVVPRWQASILPQVPQTWAPRDSLSTIVGVGASKEQNDVPAVGLLPRPTERTTIDFPTSEAATQASPSLQRATSPANAVPTWPALLVGFYLCGAAALLLHLAAGAAGVVRLMRAAEAVPDGPLRREFDAALAQLGVERDVRLLESTVTAVPVAWEVIRPAVLMPRAARRWPSERRRVAFLHELAHVRRRDCQMQLVAHLALSLHWLNPLAWLALRRLRTEREHACDDAVLSLGTRASDYADHLLQIARGLLPRREPAWASLAMARTPQLEGRVAAILDTRNSRRLPHRRATMIAMILSLALLLPLAALQPGVAAQAVGQPAALPHAAGSKAVEHRQATTHLSPTAPATGRAGTASVSAVEAQQGQPSIDELIQMRIHGVSTEFIDAVREAFGRPLTVRELVQMRIHGTTPEFVLGAQAEFPGEELSIEGVNSLRIHGASLDYIREMRDVLGNDLTVSDITNLRIHGASPEYVRAMRGLLGAELSPRDVTSMRIHGVTTALVRELQEDGFEDLTVDDLVKMKIHGFDRWLRRRGGR